MSANSVEGLFRETLDKIRAIVDVNTVVGQPITTENGTVVLPISKASIGLVVGGGDTIKGNNPPFAGGTGAGVNITPVGFLVINNGKCEMISVDNSTNFSEFFGLANHVIDAFSKSEIGEEIVKTFYSKPLEKISKIQDKKDEKVKEEKSEKNKNKKMEKKDKKWKN